MINKLFNRIRRHLGAQKAEPLPGDNSTAKPDAATDIEDQAPGNNAATDALPTTGESPPKKRRRRRKRNPSQATAAADSPTAQALQDTAPWSPENFQVPPAEGKSRFHDLDLPPELMRAIHALGFQYCTPIQAEILPPTLAGHDAFGKAQTGTGKSAAFLISIITRLLRQPDTAPRELARPKALILAPTRELAIQIHRDAEDLTRFSELNCVAVFGGTDYDKQRRMFEQAPVDLLIATPGRLLDFARQKVVLLGEVQVLVVDEADRLLDMGFIPDVRRIIQQTPEKSRRQTLFFSATLTSQIANLSAQWTKDPVTVEIEPEQVASESVEQLVYMVTAKEKMTVLYNLITGKQLERVIVFCNRRDVTRRVRERLYRHDISCAMLSGEVSQQQRMKTLDNFKEGKIRVLVATDVAGRGLHIEGISHVINYNLPEDAEDYVHRIGRTGRAGASGISVSFADEEESFYLPAIEEYMGRKLSCVYPDDELLITLPPPVHKAPPVDKSLSGGKGGGRPSRSGGRGGPPRRGGAGRRPSSPPRRRS
ncbi:ATP-dependent RNA helicase RhlB [Desulfurivibrio dismutans]|uniref:ATP-dependent RNA helicase RhlB n=1 Tax=Desulfurivibrio dismutans TaxID=1398908 RepID=UPI0023DB3AA0|nr:ATP-dependent RNA helicase RhlB [Desulfurivibrio alkaliphilus]MDF1613708.1 ATP-dependent RNA helicase RhlB [Desulfurivibrio alkaliphilus]